MNELDILGKLAITLFFFGGLGFIIYFVIICVESLNARDKQ